MYYRALACFCLFSASAVIFSSSTPRHKQLTLFLFYFFFSSTNRNRILPFKSFALWMPLKTSPFCSIWTLLSFISFTATSRVASMNLLQSGFPLNTCSRGISDGQQDFSKPLCSSTSNIAVSIRSFTKNSSGASSFSKVALKASFFVVFVFVFFFVVVKGSLMMMMMMMMMMFWQLQLRVKQVQQKCQKRETDDKTNWEQKQSKRDKKKRDKKNSFPKSSSFSSNKCLSFNTRIIARASRYFFALSLSLSRDEDEDDRGESFFAQLLWLFEKTKDDGVDFLRVVVQFRRHPQGATT